MVRKRAPNIKQRGKTIITPNKPRRPKLSSSAAATQSLPRSKKHAWASRGTR